MKIILPGGTGHLGHLLVRAFTRAGHTCVVLTRDADSANHDLTRAGLGRDPRFAIPAPAWLLELGAIFHRTETELLLKSRRVVPARLHAAGFRFLHPSWPEAARELAAR